MKYPECGSEKWRMNALLDFDPAELRDSDLLYTCADCQNQYNPSPDNKDGLLAIVRKDNPPLLSVRE